MLLCEPGTFGWIYIVSRKVQGFWIHKIYYQTISLLFIVQVIVGGMKEVAWFIPSKLKSLGKKIKDVPVSMSSAFESILV